MYKYICHCRASSCLFCYPSVGAEYQHPASALSSAVFSPNLTLRFGVDMLWNPKLAHNNHFVKIFPHKTSCFLDFI